MANKEEHKDIRPPNLGLHWETYQSLWSCISQSIDLIGEAQDLHRSGRGISNNLDALTRLLMESERLVGELPADPEAAATRTEAEDILRSLASWLGNGGYNAPTVDPAAFEAKIRDGIINTMIRVEAARAAKAISGQAGGLEVVVNTPDTAADWRMEQDPVMRRLKYLVSNVDWEDWPGGAAEILSAYETAQGRLARLYDYERRLSEVMPKDFKDWFQCHPDEHPELVVGVITSLRKDIQHLLKLLQEEADGHEGWEQQALKDEAALRHQVNALNVIIDQAKMDLGDAGLTLMLRQAVIAEQSARIVRLLDALRECPCQCSHTHGYTCPRCAVLLSALPPNERLIADKDKGDSCDVTDEDGTPFHF